MRGAFLSTAVLAISFVFCHEVYADAFDGRWEVNVDAELPCATIPRQRFGIMISRNRLKIEESNATAGAQISGLVNRQGKLTGRVSRGNHIAKGEGALVGEQGEGSWKSEHCKGTWKAKRTNLK